MKTKATQARRKAVPARPARQAAAALKALSGQPVGVPGEDVAGCKHLRLSRRERAAFFGLAVCLQQAATQALYAAHFGRLSVCHSAEHESARVARWMEISKGTLDAITAGRFPLVKLANLPRLRPA